MANYYVDTLRARGDYWSSLFAGMAIGALLGILYGSISGLVFSAMFDDDWYINRLTLIGVVLGIGWGSFNQGVEVGVALEKSLRPSSESQQSAEDEIS